MGSGQNGTPRADRTAYRDHRTRGKADVTSTANPIPVTSVLSGLLGASAMAVDATYVYWATPNAIGRAALDGNNSDPLFIQGVFNPNALAVDRVNQYIYWADSNSGYIGRAPLVKGTTAVQTRYISTLGVASGLAIDYVHGYLYWTQNSNRWIGRVPLAGGSRT